MSIIKLYEENKIGRDFVVGDIHGMFDWLREMLLKIKFDTKKDRLFSVGDLVDRGALSAKPRDYLSKSWFHCVQGNHEEMIVLKDYRYARHWMAYLTDKEIDDFEKIFKELPLVIEVKTSYGKVGIVHAEVHSAINDWNIFKGEIVGGLEFSEEVRTDALWGRTRIEEIDRILESSAEECNTDSFKNFFKESKHRDYIKNIDYTVHGHSIRKTPVVRGNQIFIDTGAYANSVGLFSKGGLSILEFTDKEAMKIHSYSNFYEEQYNCLPLKDVALML